MAYDKVVDSAFLEAGLKKVGDSIRAKAGTSELLEFPDAMSAAVDAIDTSENLDEVLDEQESIIDQLQAALEGKAGANVETCTVALSGYINYCVVTTYDNGVITSHYYEFSGLYIDFAAPVELTNVVCNSIMIIKSNAGIPLSEIDEEIQLLTGETINASSENLQIFSAPTQFGRYEICATLASGGGGN